MMFKRWNEPPTTTDWVIGTVIFTVIVCAMILWLPRL